MIGPVLSVAVDDLRLEFKAALSQARRMGFHCIDVDATRGPVSAQALDRSGRRHLLRHLSDLNLRLGSIRGPTAGAGYADSAGGERRLDAMKKIVSLAVELGVPVVSTMLGAAAEGASESNAARLHEALASLADIADRGGVCVAIESTGVATGELSRLLREINCPLLGSCCDSGALLMQGEPPAQAVSELGGRIRLVRARDAVAGVAGQGGQEKIMGEGHLDPVAFIAALAESGFDGPIILARTTGHDPAQDLLRAKQAVERLLFREI